MNDQPARPRQPKKAKFTRPKGEPRRTTDDYRRGQKQDRHEYKRLERYY